MTRGYNIPGQRDDKEHVKVVASIIGSIVRIVGFGIAQKRAPSIY